jgi:hypothetical protein
VPRDVRTSSQELPQTVLGGIVTGDTASFSKFALGSCTLPWSERQQESITLRLTQFRARPNAPSRGSKLDPFPMEPETIVTQIFVILRLQEPRRYLLSTRADPKSATKFPSIVTHGLRFMV